MKVLTYSIGLICSIAISIGWLFKLMKWPNGDPIFFYGFLSFVFIFLPLLALLRYLKNEVRSRLTKFKYTLGYSSAFMVGASAIFKVMHYQGAVALLVMGMGFFSLGFLPILFYQLYKNA